jgi:hypothetical protein
MHSDLHEQHVYKLLSNADKMTATLNLITHQHANVPYPSKCCGSAGASQLWYTFGSQIGQRYFCLEF